MTAKEFVKLYQIGISSRWSAENPHMADSNRMNNYKTTLTKDGKQFTLYYSKGVALEGEPTAEEVIECLASDYNCVQYGFEDFLSNLGYEEPEGRKVYRTIENQIDKLQKLLGSRAFEDFKEIREED